MAWRLSPRLVLTLDVPRLLGIVNVTPDSFSDGGAHDTAPAAIAHGQRLRADGADILDVGGESTRPGAERIAPALQIDRVRPVIQALTSEGAIVSVDTTRAEVAAAALDAGATIVNDVSGGTEDHELLPLVAERGCGVILMHRLAPPDQDAYSTEYRQAPDYGDDVVAAVRHALAGRRDEAGRLGVAPDAIVLDPGVGFGKSVDQNFALLAGIHELSSLGPILSAASRKSFLGAVTAIDEPAARDDATLAVSVAHALLGVRLFRIHDVRGHRSALAVALRLADHGAGTAMLPRG